MPNIIPILILVDGKEIVKTVGTGGTFENPLPLNQVQSKCIYMIANNSFVGNYNRTANLQLNANPEDIVQWRMTAIGRDVYSPIMVKYVSNNSEALESPFQGILHQPYYIQKDGKSPDGATEMVVKADVELMASVLEKDQKVVYHLNFKLVDHGGNTVGYYKWDPSILTGE